MRPSLPSLLASAASHGRGSLTRASPSALLPPVPLYRRILRAHRKHLPREMRVLGDQYVKAEFRAHRDVDNPVHLVSLRDGLPLSPPPFFGGGDRACERW